MKRKIKTGKKFSNKDQKESKEGGILRVYEYRPAGLSYSDFKKQVRGISKLVQRMVKKGEISQEVRRQIIRELKRAEKVIIPVEKKTVYFLSLSRVGEVDRIVEEIERAGGVRVRIFKRKIVVYGRKDVLLGITQKHKRKFRVRHFSIYRDGKTGKFLSRRKYEKKLIRYIDINFKEKVKRVLRIDEKQYNLFVKFVRDKEHLLRVANYSPSRFAIVLWQYFKAFSKRKGRK
jgi:polyhydroxyalkanoate synthesis regulator phasin